MADITKALAFLSASVIASGMASFLTEPWILDEDIYGDPVSSRTLVGYALTGLAVVLCAIGSTDYARTSGWAFTFASPGRSALTVLGTVSLFVLSSAVSSVLGLGLAEGVATMCGAECSSYPELWPH
jgi:hypothetical protein